MDNVPNDYDAIGVVVDWIDACRKRRLDALLELYDESAILECCSGGTFRGRGEIGKYWGPKLAGSGNNAFEIDGLMPEQDGVLLDYRGYEGAPVRTRFRFTSGGKIRLTACTPVTSM